MTRIQLIAWGQEKRRVFDNAMNADIEQEDVCLPVSCLRYMAEVTAYVSK
jgi:hypothetical protein